MALFLAPGLNDHHVRGDRLRLSECVRANGCNPNDLNARLTGKETLNALSEERLAGKNEYARGIHQ